MKRVLCVFLICSLLFCGCSSNAVDSLAGFSFREKLQKGKGCRFTAQICADYGDEEHNFSMACKVDEKGELAFSVLEPKTISGIGGSIDHDSGKLIFDDTVLHFPLLAEGEISPVCAPWVLYKALLGGYIRAEGKDGAYIRISIDDSYQGENISFDVWIKNGVPVAAELFWLERNIISLHIIDFEIL